MTMRYILDTDHGSLGQRGNTHVRANLAQISSVDQHAVTMMTVIAQLQGRGAVIHQACSEVEVARGGERGQETLAFSASMHVLPYDTDAQGPFAHLRRRRVRIGTQDWRSAAIALRWRATVVTRNSRDVVQVPGLNIVDWSIA